MSFPLRERDGGLQLQVKASKGSESKVEVVYVSFGQHSCQFEFWAFRLHYNRDYCLVMQSLLRWSIENSSPHDASQSNSSPAGRNDLDPGIIDAILGRPDAELMKEDLAIALDASKSEDERVDALDHLEMVCYFITFPVNYLVARAEACEP
jgi:hypothetical protein